jgi:hypothetical protein
MLGLIRRQAPNMSIAGAVVAGSDVRRHGGVGAVLNSVSLSVRAGELACLIGRMGVARPLGQAARPVHFALTGRQPNRFTAGKRQ